MSGTATADTAAAQQPPHVVLTEGVSLHAPRQQQSRARQLPARAAPAHEGEEGRGSGAKRVRVIHKEPPSHIPRRTVRSAAHSGDAPVAAAAAAAAGEKTKPHAAPIPETITRRATATAHAEDVEKTSDTARRTGPETRASVPAPTQTHTHHTAASAAAEKPASSAAPRRQAASQPQRPSYQDPVCTVRQASGGVAVHRVSSKPVQKPSRPSALAESKRLPTNGARTAATPRNTTTGARASIPSRFTPKGGARTPRSVGAGSRKEGAAGTALSSSSSAAAAAANNATAAATAKNPYDVGLAQTSQQRTAARRSRQPRKIMCVAFSKYSLVRRVAEANGFELQETEEEFDEYQFNMCWSDTVLPLVDIVRLSNWQRTNHFPSMYLLCRKAHLGTTLGQLRRKLPTHFNFYPFTWTMRGERVHLSRYLESLAKKKTVKFFIMKPSAGCQGRGIVVTSDPFRETVEDFDNYIVQEYIPRPLLIDGLKFDLRLYVLLTSIREPSIFLFGDGLVRLCTEPYEPPTEHNAGDVCKHLTNYAVNKRSAAYAYNTDVDHMDVGSKRNFAFFNRWMREEGHDVEAFWDKVGFLICKTVLAAQPRICHVYNNCFPRFNDGYSCFEVLGFDVLVDSRLKPWLMEVNHTPSLAADTPLDEDIKSRLLTETWDIIDCRATDHERDRQREREAFAKRNMQTPAGPPTPRYLPGGLKDEPPSLLSSPAPAHASAAGVAGGEAEGQAAAPAHTTCTGRPVSDAVYARRLREDSKLKHYSRIYPSEKREHQLVYDTLQNMASRDCDAALGPGGAATPRTPVNASQMAQNERLRRDLRDIVNHTFAARTPRGTATPRRGSSVAARTPRQPIPKGDDYQKMKDDMQKRRRSGPATTAPPPPSTAAAAATKTTTPSDNKARATSEARKEKKEGKEEEDVEKGLIAAAPVLVAEEAETPAGRDSLGTTRHSKRSAEALSPDDSLARIVRLQEQLDKDEAEDPMYQARPSYGLEEE